MVLKKLNRLKLEQNWKWKKKEKITLIGVSQ